MDYFISTEDKAILREVAKKQVAFAHTSSNQQKIKEWYAHNALQGQRPMIHLELWTFSHEILPKLLKCTGAYARDIETTLYCNFLNQELFDDDQITPDFYSVSFDTHFELFDIPIQVDHTFGSDGTESLGHQFKSILTDLEEDYHKIKPSPFGANLESTQKNYDAITDAIGHILPVKMNMDCLYSVPTQMLVHMMSMENMMYAMYDYPELFLKMMNQIADDTLAYYQMLTDKRLILPTTSFQSVGQGSWAFTNELPGLDEWQKRPFTPKDVWGFMDSQETVGISPEMYETFIFPCYQKIASQFGLLSYGCCEPVDAIWDRCISKLTNLRKVSISPWCNEKMMGKRLADSKVIYHRKPSPNFLGVDTILDETAFRSHIKESLLAAKGCKMEITQRDVYTIHHNIEKARRYVDIIKEEIVNHWQ